MFDVSTIIRKDASCSDLLNCVFGLKRFEEDLFYTMSAGGTFTLDRLASATSRDRSTVHRALSRLTVLGLCYRRTVSLRGGGYQHEYAAMDPDTVVEGLRGRIEELKSALDRLADSFGSDLVRNIEAAAAGHRRHDAADR